MNLPLLRVAFDFDFESTRHVDGMHTKHTQSPLGREAQAEGAEGAKRREALDFLKQENLKIAPDFLVAWF